MKKGIRLSLLTRHLSVALLIFGVLSTTWVNAELHPAVAELISQAEEPEGVVIDIESNDPNYWQRRGAFVQHQIQSLKKQWPDLDIVVISHGRELKQLAAASQDKDSAIKRQITILNEAGIEVQVCAVASDVQGLDEDAFASSIEIADSGPASRNNYIQLGYSVVYLQKFTDKQMKDFFRSRLSPSAESVKH